MSLCAIHANEADPCQTRPPASVTERVCRANPQRGGQTLRAFAKALIVLAGVSLFVQPTNAARLLDVYVELDGETIAHTFYDDSGREDAATVWRYLGEPKSQRDSDCRTGSMTTKLAPLADTVSVICRLPSSSTALADCRVTRSSDISRMRATSSGW